MKKPYYIELELYRDFPIKTTIEYMSGDKDAYPLYLQLKADKEPFIIDIGTDVYLNFQLSNGIELRNKAYIEDAEQGLVIYKIVGDEISILGNVAVQVELLSKDEKLQFPRFYYRVTKSVGYHPKAPEAFGDWTRDLEQRILEMENRSICDVTYDILENKFMFWNILGELVKEVDIDYELVEEIIDGP